MLDGKAAPPPITIARARPAERGGHLVLVRKIADPSGDLATRTVGGGGLRASWRPDPEGRSSLDLT
jgi:hypothetical protein